MRFLITKLTFLTGVHIGAESGGNTMALSKTGIHSDTFFSALCCEAALNDPEMIHTLYRAAADARLLFSDLLPFKGNVLYLPKPLTTSAALREQREPDKRKLYKRLVYIPLSMYGQYLGAAEKGFDVEAALEEYSDIVVQEKRQRVTIDANEGATPYFIGLTYYNDDCGLYFILGYESDEEKKLVTNLTTLLGLSGIGGRKSSGLGKFNAEFVALDDSNTAWKVLKSMLENDRATGYVTINTSLPRKDEMASIIPQANVQLIRRGGGFIQSYSYADTQLKKKTIFALAAGASTGMRFGGDIYDLSSGGNHLIYRNLKPMFLGVEV